MPSLRAMVLAGSGDIEAPSMTGRADVTIAGSGTAAVSAFDAESLDLTIAGSGDFSAGGKVETLDLTIAGSGKAEMPDLAVGDADISVAGSGDAEFASDGRVDASIMGSGHDHRKWSRELHRQFDGIGHAQLPRSQGGDTGDPRGSRSLNSSTFHTIWARRRSERIPHASPSHFSFSFPQP